MSTLLLNHFNGTDGSTTFTDEVPGITWSLGVDILGELDTALPKFGSAAWRGITDGSFNDAGIKASGFTLSGSGSWTVEAFLAMDTIAFAGSIVSIDLKDVSNNTIAEATVTGGSGDNGWSSYFNPTSGGPHQASNFSAGLAINTYYHVALVRDAVAQTYSVFFNGVRVANHSNSSGHATPTQVVIRANLANSGTNNGGWIDEVRLTDEVVYSGSTYIVPTVEFNIGLGVFSAEMGSEHGSPGLVIGLNTQGGEFGHESGQAGLAKNIDTDSAEFDYEGFSTRVQGGVIPDDFERGYEAGSPSMTLLVNAAVEGAEFGYESGEQISPSVFSPEFDYEISPPGLTSTVSFGGAPLDSEYGYEVGNPRLRHFMRVGTRRRIDAGSRSRRRRVVPAEIRKWDILRLTR